MRTIGLLVVFGAIFARAIPSCFAQIVDDSFGSGTDAGWTHLEPLSSFGAQGTYGFPNGGYRIQASASPDPAHLGPARAGSFRYDTYTVNYDTEVDVVGFNSNLNQSFGLIGHVTAPGVGTTSGYAGTVSTTGSINLWLIQGEVMTLLDTHPIVVDPTHSYRLFLSGNSTGIGFEVRDLQNPRNGGAVGGGAKTFPIGLSGLFAMSNVPGGTADATFDDFRAFVNVPEPSTWSLLAGGAILFSLFFRRSEP